MSAQNKTESLLSAREEMKAESAYSRLSKLFDDGIFTEIDAFAGSAGGYAEVAAGRGTVLGTGVYAFAQNSDISGGAMSKAQAAKIKKVYELAVKTGSPVIALYDSIGGRLDEEADLLGAYGDVLRSSGNLSGVVPQISVVLGKCYGTQALIAVNGDIVIMSEKAELSLATDGSGASAKENAESGVAHITAKDEDEAIAKARELMELLPSNNLDYAGTVEFDDADEASENVIDTIADGGSVIELQADFLAGLWGHDEQALYGSMEKGDLEEALNTALVIGDDYLQKRATGRTDTSQFTHGTSAQRKKWFNKGFTSGDISQGNTFAINYNDL